MNTSMTDTFIAKDEFELIQSATDYPLERSRDGRISGWFFRSKLTSVFQPVINATQNKTIGHIAYIRSGEITLSSWQAFAQAANDEELVNLDSLCRTIHVLNYFNKANSSYKLFVEVHPRLLENTQSNHGRIFEDLLNLIGIKTSRVVIEIPPTVNRNWKLLQQMIMSYRSRGYQVATYFDCDKGEDNLIVKLGGLYPDIIRVKIRDLLQHNAAVSLINTIHHLGVAVLANDIETADQAAYAIHVGADHLQGNFFSQPTHTIDVISPHLINNMLCPDYIHM